MMNRRLMTRDLLAETTVAVWLANTEATAQEVSSG